MKLYISRRIFSSIPRRRENNTQTATFIHFEKTDRIFFNLASLFRYQPALLGSSVHSFNDKTKSDVCVRVSGEKFPFEPAIMRECALSTHDPRVGPVRGNFPLKVRRKYVHQNHIKVPRMHKPETEENPAKRLTLTPSSQTDSMNNQWDNRRRTAKVDAQKWLGNNTSNLHRNAHPLVSRKTTPSPNRRRRRPLRTNDNNNTNSSKVRGLTRSICGVL